MSYTLADLRTELREELWPEGEAENLVTAHNKLFVEAMIDLQRWIKCLQNDHVDIYPQCATMFRCGRTVLDAPRGRIRRVYAISGEDYCGRVIYRQRDYNVLENWSRRFNELVDAPANTGLPAVALSFKYPDATTDSEFGRALVGIWAEHRGNLYVAPWLQSDESLVVEWDGLKRTWSDTDEVPDEDDYKRAVKLYVAAMSARDFDNDPGKFTLLWNGTAPTFQDGYIGARADLLYECQQETMVREDNRNSEDVESMLAAEAETSTDDSSDFDDDDTHVNFAVIGQFGSDDANEEAVADLVKGVELNFIATTGNNNWANDGSVDFEERVAQYYADYIHPCTSLKYPGGSTNVFFPAIGSLDYYGSGGNALNKWHDFFTLPNNERYYDVVRGAVHLFFINSNSAETDGITSTSTQGKWLQARLALATAPWKIVVLHHSPYSSGQNGSYSQLRWPFVSWGADLVLSGSDRNYERLEVAELPYIVVGTGGAALTDEGTTLATQEEFVKEFGALFIEADCDTLVASFKNTDGTEKDSLTLTK